MGDQSFPEIERSYIGCSTLMSCLRDEICLVLANFSGHGFSKFLAIQLTFGRFWVISSTSWNEGRVCDASVLRANSTATCGA